VNNVSQITQTFLESFNSLFHCSMFSLIIQYFLRFFTEIWVCQLSSWFKTTTPCTNSSGASRMNYAPLSISSPNKFSGHRVFDQEPQIVWRSIAAIVAQLSTNHSCITKVSNSWEVYVIISGAFLKSYFNISLYLLAKTLQTSQGPVDKNAAFCSVIRVAA
jgi:hypothetical protein